MEKQADFCLIVYIIYASPSREAVLFRPGTAVSIILIIDVWGKIIYDLYAKDPEFPVNDNMKDARLILILLAFTLFLFFYGLGNTALTDPDETFYAQTAKEMLDGGDWLTPVIFGQPQFEKPAFYYWLIMLSYKAFGVNEFAARFPSVIFGIAGVIGIYFLGRLLFSRRCGFFSGLVLATSAQYIVLARGCVTDMVLSVFILYCMLFFLLGAAGGKKAYFVLASVMAALAVLTKGPIGLFIPGMAVLLYLSIARQWGVLKKVPFFSCLAAFLAVALPWYILAIWAHGSAFIDEFFLFRNVTRFMEPEHSHSASPFFYIPVLLVGFFPWSPFLPLGAWRIFREGPWDNRVKGQGIFLAGWFLVVFIFFSVSGTKLVTYILPLYPVAALVVARFWENFIEAGERDPALRKYMDISYAAFVSLSAIALVGLIIVVNRKYHQGLFGVAMAEAVFAAGLGVSAFFYLRGRKAGSFYALPVTVLLLCFPLVLSIMPVIEEYETSKAISLKFTELAKPGEPLGAECDHRRGVAFYSGRTEVVDIHPYHELNNFVARKQRVWGIIQRKHYDQLRAEVGAAVQDPVFESGEYVLITNKPLQRGEGRGNIW